MDQRLSAELKESSFGSTWRPRMGRESDERPKTGRRSFLGRGAAAVAAGVAAFGGREARAGNPNYLPSLYPNQNVAEFQAIQAHENAHVNFLVMALGAAARPLPTFQNLTQTTLLAFAQTSRALENTGVGAYLGAAPYIYNKDYLAAAGSILTIEARHSGYVDVLLDMIMTVNAAGDQVSFDVPLDPTDVVDAAGGFIKSLNDNGNFPLTYSTTPSPENDIAILNFALALEYLEAAFYNINVPIFT